MQLLPIVEIFHSVQGEGFHNGIPHVFVRFGKCNLRCEWCDTDFMTFEERDLDSIVGEILSYDCERVIFTGGEPAMHDLSTIGGRLKEHGISLSIETNGTIPIDPVIDWICVSPRTSSIQTSQSSSALVTSSRSFIADRSWVCMTI